MTDEILTTLSEKMKGYEDMQQLSEVMGVSLATAYRYRKDPKEMPMSAFSKLVEFLNIPVSISVGLKQEDALEAEAKRLRIEEAIAESGGSRIVTTPVFSVNCEIEDFTRATITHDYFQKLSDAEINEYVALRQRRRKLYLSGDYKSTELVNGASYLDFYYRKSPFKHVSEKIWAAQREEIVSTSMMSHVRRAIYMRSTPQLPIILCFSTQDIIVRLDDLTLFLPKHYYGEMFRTIQEYKNNCRYKSRDEVTAFLINPLNPTTP